MIAVLLAEGFEEIEALSPVDLLRRAGVKTVTAGVGGRQITGAHGIAVAADCRVEELHPEELTGIVLPGGMPGTKNLEASDAVQSLITHCAKQGKLIGAICAAPSVLGHRGLLAGRQATCFPGFEAACEGARLAGAPAVKDGNIITARGAGCAWQFAAELVAALKGRETAEQLLRSIQMTV